MAISASVVDGELVYDYTSSSSSSTTTSGSDLGYDEFLQLLCAEMEYQDPLEPTSNTDYVAQLATFSQLEATLSLENTETSTMANDLVGKQVILAVTSSSTGNTTYVSGPVDYVLYQDGDVYLSVNDSLYSIDTLDTVADDGYYEAVTLSDTFGSMIDALPEYSNLTSSYSNAIQELRDFYDGLTTYQQKYITSDDLATLTKYETRVKELVAAEEAAAEEAEETTETE